MSPNQISILLSIHVCGTVDRALIPTTAPNMLDCVKQFMRNSMIDYDGDQEPVPESELHTLRFKLTERGQYYVEYLQHIPLPREKTSWVIDQLPFPPEHS